MHGEVEWSVYSSHVYNQSLDEHFFHLSFENSVCPEYQSEKFWRVKQLIVPIVLSRANIAASDFESPSHLARYLKMLMGNRTEYAKYFEWTKNFRRTPLSESERRVACQLCKLAHSNAPIQINNIKRYWSTDECPKNYAIDLINNPRRVKKHENRITRIMRETYRNRRIEKIL
ncbi:Alpha-(1,3)-fucosyltransferase C [Aphelenchoides besseyi]|nr:Alpha-(1,3)-fucosyltransferase C [Aphelenchoides besseyi]